MTDFPPWMKRSTLCEYLDGVSVNTVESYVAKGILPPGRMRGGNWWWSRAEVDAWMRDGKPGGSPDREADDVRESTKRALAEAFRTQLRGAHP